MNTFPLDIAKVNGILTCLVHLFWIQSLSPFKANTTHNLSSLLFKVQAASFYFHLSLYMLGWVFSPCHIPWLLFIYWTLQTIVLKIWLVNIEIRNKDYWIRVVTMSHSVHWASKHKPRLMFILVGIRLQWRNQFSVSICERVRNLVACVHIFKWMASSSIKSTIVKYDNMYIWTIKKNILNLYILHHLALK